MPESALVGALLCVGMSLLIVSYQMKKRENLISALSAWQEARRKSRDAKTNLRRAERTLSRAQRRTTRTPKRITAIGEDGNTSDLESLRVLYNEEQVAKTRHATAARKLELARASVNGKIKELDSDFRCSAKSWKGKLKNGASAYIKAVPNLIRCLRCAFAGWIDKIKNHQWLAGAALTLTAIVHNYVYYSQFNFNVFPYFSDLAIDALLAVVLAMTAAIVVLILTCFAAASFLILLARAALPLSIIVLTMAAMLLWEWLFRSALWFCRRSVRLTQLAALVGRGTTMFIVPLRALWSTTQHVRHVVGLMRARLVAGFARTFGVVNSAANERTEMKKQTETDDGAGMIWTTRAVSLIIIAIGVTGMACIVSIEPQYRAHVACRDENRVEFIVQRSPEGPDDAMVKVGSNGNYIFAVPAASCSGRSVGATGTRWIGERGDFVGGNLGFDEPGILKSIAFLANSLPSDFNEPVVVLPITRVRCMYGPSSLGRGLAVCDTPKPRIADRGERLLRNQLKKDIDGCARLVMSQPLVFMPEEWKRPIDGVMEEIDEFAKRHGGRLAGNGARTLYVFGFASADGADGYNEQLAVDRARTIQHILSEKYSNWTVKTSSLGEDHLTNSVADSRSARLVFCKGRGDTENTSASD